MKDQNQPVPHHFIVRSQEWPTEKRYVEQKAEWIRRELKVAFHDETVTVEVVYE